MTENRSDTCEVPLMNYTIKQVPRVKKNRFINHLEINGNQRLERRKNHKSQKWNVCSFHQKSVGNEILRMLFFFFLFAPFQNNLKQHWVWCIRLFTHHGRNFGMECCTTSGDITNILTGLVSCGSAAWKKWLCYVPRNRRPVRLKFWVF